MGNYTTIQDHTPAVRIAIGEILSEGEHYCLGVHCTDAVRSKKQTRLVLTTDRILELKPTRSSEATLVNAIDRESIAEVEYDKGTLTRTLRIRNADGFTTEWGLDYQGADDFIEALKTAPGGSFQDPVANNSDTDRQSSSLHRRRNRGQADNSPQTTLEQNTATSNTTGIAAMDPSPDSLKHRLREIDPYQFEHFVADLWKQMGWDTTVSQAASDAGIDVLAEKSTPYPQKKVIQAKRYGSDTTVGGPAIQQYASLRHQVPDADSVIVVTTSRFTSAAKERAQELNVKLVDGDGLVEMIDDLEARDLVAEYLDIPLEQSVPHPESDSEIQVGADRPFESSEQQHERSQVNTTHHTSRDAEGQSAVKIGEQPIRHSPHTPSEQTERGIEARGSETETTPSEGDVSSATEALSSEIAATTESKTAEWTYIVGATGMLWGSLAFGEISAALGGLMLLIGWVGLPYAHYRDRAWLGRWWIGYAGLAAIPGLGLFSGPVYLVHRYLRVGLNRL